MIDADGKKQELTITVTPKTLILDALDLKTMVATQLTHPGRREIKRMTSTTTGIKPWKNGSVAYARALYQATGSLTIEIFNRHETKKQYLTYETIAIGPTYEQYMTARAEARARAAANQGKRSSITPSDLIRAGLDPCYSVRSCQRYSSLLTPVTPPTEPVLKDLKVKLLTDNVQV